MRNCVFMNVKGFSIEQAITALNDQLQVFYQKPENKKFNVHQVVITPTVELPAQGRIASVQPQPQMVVNITCVLQEPDQVQEKFQEKVLNTVHNVLDVLLLDIKNEPDQEPGDNHTELIIAEPGPADQQEVEKIKQAAALFCQHEKLKPAKYSKAHRNEGDYYQICENCGAEVWASGSVYPAGGGGGKNSLTAV